MSSSRMWLDLLVRSFRRTYVINIFSNPFSLFQPVLIVFLNILSDCHNSNEINTLLSASRFKKKLLKGAQSIVH